MKLKNLKLKDVVEMFSNATSRVVNSDYKSRVNLGVNGLGDHSQKKYDYVSLDVNGKEVIVLITKN